MSVYTPSNESQCLFCRGVAEHSHRSQLAADILNTMKADLASFLDIPDTHEILIMQGDSTPGLLFAEADM